MASIIFDLDGTLIDSAPDLQRIANRILHAAARPPLTLEETRSFIGAGVGVFVEKMCAARDMPDQDRRRHLEAFARAYESAFDLTVAYPGARDALASLKDRGLRLAVCTNKPMAPCRAVLEHLRLRAFFDVIVAGDSLGRRKPDPLPLEWALRQLGGRPALYVGDSEVDAETADRASVPFLLFTQGYRKVPVDQLPHAASFDSFDDLSDLIDAQLHSGA